jgi:hypothetical protein
MLLDASVSLIHGVQGRMINESATQDIQAMPLYKSQCGP